jgi:hypothetical protein
MSGKPSRTVTNRTCVVCERKFTPSRRDAAYCSAACRQRAARSRAEIEDIDERITQARRLYWSLIRQKAEALRKSMSQVVTGESQTVDAEGNVFMHGKLVGKVQGRPGWTSWGIEAAGPPFSIPSHAKVLARMFKELARRCPHCDKPFLIPEATSQAPRPPRLGRGMKEWHTDERSLRRFADETPRRC